MKVLEPVGRLAQLVLIPVVTATFAVTDDVSISERGSAGSGSSGER
jgi:dUTPase